MVPWRDGQWDRCILGGERVPGLARVTVVASRDVSLVASPGKDAPSLKDGGGRGATIKLEVEVWTTRTDHSQVTELSRLLARLDPRRPGAAKSPVSIVHPATAMANIQHLASATYTIPPITGGRLVVPIDCVQWFPEEDATTPANTAPPANSAGGAGGGPGGIGDGGPFGDGSVPEPDPDNLGADYP